MIFIFCSLAESFILKKEKMNTSQDQFSELCGIPTICQDENDTYIVLHNFFSLPVLIEQLKESHQVEIYRSSRRVKEGLKKKLYFFSRGWTRANKKSKRRKFFCVSIATHQSS